jgi:hypothetical protein
VRIEALDEILNGNAHGVSLRVIRAARPAAAN